MSILKVRPDASSSWIDIPAIQGPVGPVGPVGKDGADGKTPERGVDYWTAADKAEIVNEVLTSLPVYNGEVVDG